MKTIFQPSEVSTYLHRESVKEVAEGKSQKEAVPTGPDLIPD